MRYIWQHPDWPNFQYEITKEVQDILYQYALDTGALSTAFDKSSERDALIEFMVSEAISTSKIEGEILDQEDVRSSIFNQLGLSHIPHKPKDPRSVGIAQLMISVRETFNEPLSEEQLFSWHKMILPNPSYDLLSEIGKWRTSQEPMQVVSGPIGKQRVHFEAPPSLQVPEEMKRFIRWFNDSHPITGKTKIVGPVRAAVAHLYFESIHPFADGNGRVGRAISEKVLSQELQRPILLSLSNVIYKNKRQYYQELSDASQENMNITSWVSYFVNTVYEAQMAAKVQITFVLQKAQFWNRFGAGINDRQTRVIRRMLQAGIDGFEGGISAQKYVKIADCSKATATRDLTDLYRKGALKPFPESGRSTRYALVLEQIQLNRLKND